MATQIVYTSGSGRIRGLLRDCNQTLVTQADVTGIKLNIFEYSMGQYTPVPGYSNATIPTSAILDTPATDCEGNRFNFDTDPDDGVHPPFPNRNMTYIVEVILTSTNGTKSVHQLEAFSK